ncbi:hypothetical protein PRN20_18925 [Devosia sp. ZB163]|uniref:hypothetical protein n=1 Tax=Devosia sp. ZB163 TaxID=3025938 RepID=UPI002362386F|nr:hypothetical protein [Devosia sp. ZB163]MDC9825813.1 hypothetical protein [Devosia sp. ZB163]
MLGSRNDAKDAVQDTFSQMADGRPRRHRQPGRLAYDHLHAALPRHVAGRA